MNRPLINLLATLPARYRRAWMQRRIQDTAARELVDTAAELVTAPQQHESSQLCSVVVSSAEPLLAPHAKSLYCAVQWRRYRCLVLVFFAVIFAVIFTVLSICKNETTPHNTTQINTTPEVVVVVAGREEVADIKLGEHREILPMLVAFTKGAMDNSLGLSRDELSPSVQQHRDILAAQLDAINLADAAEAMRRNHLGRAFACEVTAMREIAIDPETIPPEILPESLAPHDLARRLATDGTAAIIIPIMLVASGETTSSATGGSGTSVGVGSGAVFTDTKTWGELPTQEETLRQRSELPLIPANYWGTVQRYLEKL